MNTIDLTKKEEITKAEINLITENLKEIIKGGEMSPLLLRSKFKAIEMIMENVKNDLTQACIIESDKYPEKTKGFDLYGANFKQQEFAQKWDFAGTGDPIWAQLSSNLERAKIELKAREDFLKTIKTPEKYVDEHSGEEFTITAPVKTSTTSIVCSIK